MQSLVALLFFNIFLLLDGINGQTKVEILRSLSPECDPVKGTSWVMLEQGAKCGPYACSWPYQWCAISKVSDDNGLASTVNCIELSPQCQAKLKSSDVQFDSPPAAYASDDQQPRPPPTKGTPAPIGAAWPFARHDADGPCRDFLPNCSEMVANGSCESRRTYMRAMCPKACNRC